MEHHLNCEAPICADEKGYQDQPNWRKEVLWYAGEPVCGKSPFTRWQKRQAQINRWHAKGLFKFPELYFTVESLLNRQKIMKGTKGGNPDAMTWARYPTQGVGGNKKYKCSPCPPTHQSKKDI